MHTLYTQNAYVKLEINKMQKDSVEAVIARLKSIHNVESDSALAKALFTNAQTVSSWKSRNSIPYALCVNVARKHDVSLDWLISGTGSAPTASVNEPAATYGLSKREEIVLELFNGLDIEQQQEVIQDAKERQRIADMEKNLKALQDQMEELKKSG